MVGRSAVGDGGTTTISGPPTNSWPAHNIAILLVLVLVIGILTPQERTSRETRYNEPRYNEPRVS